MISNKKIQNETIDYDVLLASITWRFRFFLLWLSNRTQLHLSNRLDSKTESCKAYMHSGPVNTGLVMYWQTHHSVGLFIRGKGPIHLYNTCHFKYLNHQSAVFFLSHFIFQFITFLPCLICMHACMPHFLTVLLHAGTLCWMPPCLQWKLNT